MARKKTFLDNKTIVKALLSIGTDDEISRFHKMQLIEIGHLEAVKAPEAKKEQGSRGRMPYRYILTKKGKNLVTLSKGWAKPNNEDNNINTV